MKLTIDGGEIVCSQENKNEFFIQSCYGLFSGYINGKMKMRWENPDEYETTSGADMAHKLNAVRLQKVISKARQHGVEIDVSVLNRNAALEGIVADIDARQQKEREMREKRRAWELRCNAGCGNCKNLAYDIDIPMCGCTGDRLQEKNVQGYVGGVYRLFNLMPFPSEQCPLKI